MFYNKTARRVILSLIGSHKAFANKSGTLKYQPAMADGRLLWQVLRTYHESGSPYELKWEVRAGEKPWSRYTAHAALVSKRKADRLARKEAKRVYQMDYVNSFESLYPEEAVVRR